ncbi:hypothetical protein BC938DRAFT_471263 [Jimgerdemannia flammicorona]|uniref:Protein kinase domain-containing protein n=1 Tax=Jimgerdemannia flammicorona TaxID=994334 RepID=A0A433Q8H1_9FUNG|nr:hypothetical protein BC938DRAFT_471263 [Jimgerdemannia flammicorona]
MGEQEEERKKNNSHQWLEDTISEKGIMLIPFEELRKGKYAGHGTYGTVYEAMLNEKTVAIKEDESSDDLVHDVKVFALLGTHPNIVKFLGVTK